MAKILVVDDDNHYRSALRRLLADSGHDVVEAENGSEAIFLYKKGAIDVVITDLLMPEKDGIELILELKRGYKDAKNDDGTDRPRP